MYSTHGKIIGRQTDQLSIALDYKLRDRQTIIIPNGPLIQRTFRNLLFDDLMRQTLKQLGETGGHFSIDSHRSG